MEKRVLDTLEKVRKASSLMANAQSNENATRYSNRKRDLDILMTRTEELIKIKKQGISRSKVAAGIIFGIV